MYQVAFIVGRTRTAVRAVTNSSFSFTQWLGNDYTLLVCTLSWRTEFQARIMIYWQPSKHLSYKGSTAIHLHWRTESSEAYYVTGTLPSSSTVKWITSNSTLSMQRLAVCGILKRVQCKHVIPKSKCVVAQPSYALVPVSTPLYRTYSPAAT